MSISFTKKDLREISAVLRDAEEHVRGNAVQEGFRRMAMKNIGETNLAKHHEYQAEHARHTAARLVAVREFIDSAAALSVESRAIPRLPRSG